MSYVTKVTPPAPSTVLLATAIAYGAVVVIGAALRSRTYAIFRAVTLGIYGLIFWGVLSRWLATPLWPLVLYLHSTVYLHSLLLVRPRMRSLVYRGLVSIPQSLWAASILLSLPFALVAAFGFALPGFWLPALLSLIGVLQSLRTRGSQVDIVVGDGDAGELARRAHGSERTPRPLSFFQITDPHLGPFMSVSRLRAVSEAAVAENPDLVLLTGDYLTMESHGDVAHLRDALMPLAVLSGRTFACFGNHDHEAPETVRGALRAAGVQLLVDDATVVETAAGKVQIVGMDYHYRERRARMDKVLAAHPRLPGALRLVLLHHPGAFRHLPDGDADLVLSGHTHGGQVGFLSLGLHLTLLRLLMNSPDHGFWAQGKNRLYVHRGTGHYGFPLRIGVPAEQSVVRVHRVAA